MVTWQIVYSKQARLDAKKLRRSKLQYAAQELLDIIARNPFEEPPPVKALVGDLAGMYSRRISYQHRLVYDVDEESRTVHVLRMWTHYE